ncbi:hypothetical protein, partial [Actinomadura geliboluensis]
HDLGAADREQRGAGLLLRPGRDFAERDFGERDGYDDPRRTTRDPRGVPLTGPGRDTEVLR